MTKYRNKLILIKEDSHANDKKNVTLKDIIYIMGVYIIFCFKCDTYEDKKYFSNDLFLKRNKYVNEMCAHVVRSSSLRIVSVFVFQLLAEQKKFDDEMRRQLKLQSEIHADHLREALSVKEQETQRTLQRALGEQAETESIKHKTQLAAVVGRLRALTAALKGKYLSSLYILFSSEERELHI